MRDDASDMVSVAGLIGALLLAGIAANIIAVKRAVGAEIDDGRHAVHEPARIDRVTHRSAHRRSHHRLVRQARRAGGGRDETIVANPVGCPPRSFCGCGAAVEIFGRPIRALWLAANWLRFPRTAPAPGMVAARRGHVFVIREVRAPGLVLAYDPNSGGHRTRVHLRSLAGFVVVDPHRGAARYAEAGAAP